MLEAKDAPAGKMDVVMQNGWGGVLVHEAVGHPLEADNIAKKIGAFTGKLGQKVAAPVFTMVDDGTLPNFRGTTNFDDEGTPMKRNVLIQDGMLVKYMTDILSAKQIKAERTGNGRRESFRYLPIPRMTNTFIDKRQGQARRHPGLDQERPLRPEPERRQRQSDHRRLQLHLPRRPISSRTGRRRRRSRARRSSASCLDVIQNIDAVGDDLDFGPGICGKGQAAEVTAGQPTVRIRGINVGGTRAAR